MRAVRELPRLRISVGGAPLDAGQAAGLARFQVVQALSVPAQCELVFHSPDQRLAGQSAPGAAITVELDGRAPPLFSGEVTAVEHAYGASRGLEIRVRAHDLLHRLQKRQTVRTWSDVDAGAVARELLAGAGITAAVETAAPSAVWPSLLQHDQTDFEVLCDVCRRAGLHFVLRGAALHLFSLEGPGGDRLELQLGRELIEATFELNAAPACRQVVARGWDPARALALEARADVPRGGPRAGARAEPADVGGDGERLVGGFAGAGEEHTRLIAQAELDRAAAAELTLQGTAEGDPSLRPGAAVTVKGVADPLAGTYLLTEVVHTIDPDTGYLAALSTIPPPPPDRPETVGVALGVVTAVDDPDGLGRVRAQLPAHGGVETDWMQVLGLGAGAGKGLTILPDTGDHVLLCVVRGDLAQTIVLGGLSGSGHHDPGVEGGNVRRFSLLTAGGQRLSFDDHRRTVSVADGSGSHLELGPDGVRLHAAAPLTIEAPGNSLVIRAATIDFERR